MIYINQPYNISKEMHDKLPVNLCSYVRYCQKVVETGDFDGIILTNCCNGVQRLYDYMKSEVKIRFCYLLELPRKNTLKEYEFYYKSVSLLVEEMKKYFDIGDISILKKSPEEIRVKEKVPDGRTVLALGSAVSPSTMETLNDYFTSYNILVKACSTRQSGDAILEIRNKFTGRDFDISNKEFLIDAEPCPRMNDFTGWFKQFIAQQHTGLCGVVYISPQRCDNLLLSYPHVKKICDSLHIPIIQIEEEYGSWAMGQPSVRLEAFAENLGFKGKK